MNRTPSTGEHPMASGRAPAGTPPTSEPHEPQAMLDSRTVLQGRSSVTIEHNGAVYRLQTTRQGKLILTK